MRNRIKKQIMVVIKDYKGDFTKKEIMEKVLKSLEKKGLKDKAENIVCFEQTYNELKSKNKFLYLSKESKRKFYIH